MRDPDPEDLDELDRLLSDPDLAGDDDELALPPRADGTATPEMVQAFVHGSLTLVASVQDARQACRSARAVVSRARDVVDRTASAEDPKTLGVVAWLGCMDELLRFGDQLGELLTGEAV
jgi:hypothetical protein